MSIYKGIPGSSFSAYLAQENKKWAKQILSRPSIFSDIEEQEILGAAKDIENYDNMDVTVGALIRTIKDCVAARIEDVPANIVYRGKLDCRIAHSYPGPAKVGHFWVVEHAGPIGSSITRVGDCLVRIRDVHTDWMLLPVEEINAGMQNRLSPNHPINIQQKSFTFLKNRLTEAAEKGYSRPKAPPTKAAPAPAKRKVILEDD